MSLHNALRNNPALLDAFRRSMGGDWELNVERLSETLQPTVDLWSRDEWSLLFDEFIGADKWSSAAGGVGTRSIVGIRNVSDAVNPSILVIEPGTQARADSGICLGAVSATDIGGTGGVTSRDGRRILDLPRTQIRTDNTLALPVGISDNEILEAQDPVTVFTLPRAIVLGPGSALYFYASANQVGIRMAVFCRVRQLLSGEFQG